MSGFPMSLAMIASVAAEVAVLQAPTTGVSKSIDKSTNTENTVNDRLLQHTI